MESFSHLPFKSSYHYEEIFKTAPLTTLKLVSSKHAWPISTKKYQKITSLQPISSPIPLYIYPPTFGYIFDPKKDLCRICFRRGGTGPGLTAPFGLDGFFMVLWCCGFCQLVRDGQGPLLSRDGVGLVGRGSRTFKKNSYTLENERLEPENHLFEKENHLPSTSMTLGARR